MFLAAKASAAVLTAKWMVCKTTVYVWSSKAPASQQFEYFQNLKREKFGNNVLGCIRKFNQNL